MKIKALKNVGAGEAGRLRAGQTKDIPDDIARQLIRGGSCVPVEAKKADTQTTELKVEATRGEG